MRAQQLREPGPDTHIWEQLRVESAASSQLTVLSTDMTADYNQLITTSSCGFTTAYRTDCTVLTDKIMKTTSLQFSETG